MDGEGMGRDVLIIGKIEIILVDDECSFLQCICTVALIVILALTQVLILKNALQ